MLTPISKGFTYLKAKSIMNIINYLGLPCGVGKTEIIINDAIELVQRGQPVVIAVPTSALISDIAKRFDKKGAGSIVCPIHSGTHPRTVLSAASTKLAASNPEVLLITHKTLGMLGDEHRKNWVLYIDEEPETFHFHPGINLSEKYAEFLEMVTVKPQRDSDYIGLRISSDPAQVEKAHRWASNSLKDAMVEPIEDLIREIANPHTHMFVSKKNWLNFTNSDKTARVLNPVGYTSPSVLAGWQSVCICAAMFELTFTYRLWSRLGVQFRAYDPLVPLKPRGAAHARPVLISFFSKQNWTRSAITALGGMEAVFGEIKNAFPDGCIMLVFANRCDQSAIIAAKEDRTVEFGLVKSWGIGSYATQTNVVCLDVVNPPPEFWSFTAAKHGLSEHEIRIAFPTLSYYQQVMRSNARVFNSTQPLHIMVPDSHTAKWLKDNAFPDADLMFHETSLNKGVIGLAPIERRKAGRKPSGERAMSQTERSRKFRAISKRNEISDLSNTG